MVHLKRLLITSVCCSTLLSTAAIAADEEKPAKGPAEKGKVEKVGGDKGVDKGVDKGGDKGVEKNREKVAGDKGKAEKANPDKGKQEKAAQDKPGEEKAAQDKAKPPQEQVPQRRPAVRQFNERDYTRLKMGPTGPLPADKTRSTEAKETLDAAKTELTQALSSTGGNSTVQTENELWRDDTYRKASLELRRAQADYDNVRRPIFDMLREDSYYQELQKKQGESQRVIQSLVLTGRGSFDYLFPHALAALEMRKRMTREEIIAMAQAPEVEDARQRMLLAAARVRSMRVNYTAQAQTSKPATKLKDDLDAARDKVKEAQADYTAALAEEAEYERIRYNYVEEWRRTGQQPVAGSN